MYQEGSIVNFLPFRDFYPLFFLHYLLLVVSDPVLMFGDKVNQRCHRLIARGMVSLRRKQETSCVMI